MEYKCSYLLPDRPNSIDKGSMAKEEGLSFFESYNWNEELKRMNKLPDSKIHYSPSIKFDDLAENKWIEISAVGEEDNFVFYLFYKRKKEVKRLFGLRTKMDENYVSDLTDISPERTLVILNNFFNKEWEKLESWF